MPMSDPFRPIRFVLLALTVVGLIGGCSLDDLLPPGRDDPPPPDAPQATSPHPVAVERVEVQVLESFPVQVQAVVHGSLRDACTEIGAVRQVREGDTVTVSIEAVRPPEALCAQVLVPFEQVVPLDGPFPPGTYVIVVNGVRSTFTV